MGAKVVIFPNEMKKMGDYFQGKLSFGENNVFLSKFKVKL